jgi:AcrR family transcriptional regulator
MPSLEKTELKRRSIIQVAKSCFTHFGYEKTTLDDIGNRIGMNKSSLYYYFKNKEEIYSEVVVQEAELLINELQKEIAVSFTPEEKIRFYLRKRLGYYKRILSLHQLSAENLKQIQPGFHALYKSVLEREIKFISGEVMFLNAELPPATAHRIAEIIISSSDGIKHDEVIYNKINTYDDQDYTKIENDIDYLVKLILHGIESVHQKSNLNNIQVELAF